MLSLCLQLKSAKTVAHCIFDVAVTIIMVIYYGLYCFSGCGQVDAYTRVGSSMIIPVSSLVIKVGGVLRAVV